MFSFYELFFSKYELEMRKKEQKNEMLKMCTDVFISSLYAFQKVGILRESSALLCPNSSPALPRSTWTDSDTQTSALIKSLLLLLEEG